MDAVPPLWTEFVSISSVDVFTPMQRKAIELSRGTLGRENWRSSRRTTADGESCVLESNPSSLLHHSVESRSLGNYILEIR